MIAGDEEVQKVNRPGAGPKKIVTRFAPTPSGFLHLGNLYNLLLVERLAKQLGADLILRVDDLDRSRYRRKYAKDIFRMMRWLGV